MKKISVLLILCRIFVICSSITNPHCITQNKPIQLYFKLQELLIESSYDLKFIIPGNHSLRNPEFESCIFESYHSSETKSGFLLRTDSQELDFQLSFRFIQSKQFSSSSLRAAIFLVKKVDSDTDTWLENYILKGDYFSLYTDEILTISISSDGESIPNFHQKTFERRKLRKVLYVDKDGLVKYSLGKPLTRHSEFNKSILNFELDLSKQSFNVLHGDQGPIIGDSGIMKNKHFDLHINNPYVQTFTKQTFTYTVFAIKYITQKYNLTVQSFSAHLFRPGKTKVDLMISIKPEELNDYLFYTHQIFYPGTKFTIHFFYLLKNLISPWRALILPIGWTVLLITFGILVIVPMALSSRPFNLNGYVVFGALYNPLLAQGITQIPNGVRPRVLFAIILFYALIVSESYKGNQYKYLSSPYQTLDINTLDELLNSNLSLITYDSDLRRNCSKVLFHLLKSDYYNSIKKELRPKWANDIIELQYRFCRPGSFMSIENSIKHLLKYDHDIFVGESFVVKVISHTFDKLLSPHAHKTSTEIFSGERIWLVGNDSPLLTEIKKTLNSLKDSGILNYLNKVLVDYNGNKYAKHILTTKPEIIEDAQIKLQNYSSDTLLTNFEPKVLKLRQLYPTFSLLCVGILISLIMLIYEIGKSLNHKFGGVKSESIGYIK